MRHDQLLKRFEFNGYHPVAGIRGQVRYGIYEGLSPSDGLLNFSEHVSRHLALYLVEAMVSLVGDPHPDITGTRLVQTIQISRFFPAGI